MENNTPQNAGSEDFGLKVKALIKSREQLKEQNTQLEQKISELERQIKSKEAPAAVPIAPPAPAPAPAPYSPPPQMPAYQPQPPYQPQIPAYQPQPIYQPQPDYHAPQYLYPRPVSGLEQIYANAQAEAQRIVEDAHGQAEAIRAAAEMSVRALCAELEAAYSLSRDRLGEALAQSAARDKVIGGMFQGE